MSKAKQIKTVEIDGAQVVNYFYKSTVINSMFFGYVHSHLTLQTGTSIKSIASEFISAFCANDDEITEEQLIRNYYRFIPKFKKIK